MAAASCRHRRGLRLIPAVPLPGHHPHHHCHCHHGHPCHHPWTPPAPAQAYGAGNLDALGAHFRTAVLFLLLHAAPLFSLLAALPLLLQEVRRVNGGGLGRREAEGAWGQWLQK